MGKKNLDWGNLPFGYMKTTKSFVANWKNGEWDEGKLTKNHSIKMTECAGVLQYAQTCFEGLKAYTTENGDIVTFRPDLNAERMEASCKRLEMPVFPKEKFIEAVLKTTAVDIKFVNGEQRVFLDGEDVSDLIRTPEASMMASAVSALPAVRAFLLDMQRSLAKNNNAVMDGRDIGTVVLPDADVKIFLTADVEERAKRRLLELEQKGQTVSFDEVLADMKQRDYNDSHREIAPLRQAEDAVLADTTKLNLEESLELLERIVKEGTSK